MIYPHRGCHRGGKRRNNSEIIPQANNKNYNIKNVTQHLGKNITKPSALKFFHDNFKTCEYLQKNHPRGWFFICNWSDVINL